MDDEQNLARLEQLLEDTRELAEENNRILHSIKRTTWWGFWGRLILWIIVLALPFIVLGPFLKALVPVSTEGSAKSIFGFPSSDQIKSLIDAYRASSTEASS
jgi:hypothetical protein